MRIVIDEDIPRELAPLFGGLAIVVIHPHRLVVDQIKPLIPLAVAAFPTARKHAVTTIGVEPELNPVPTEKRWRGTPT